MPIERSTNKGLADIIDGVSFDLLKPSDEPIKVSVNYDIESSKKQVYDFVTSYNNLLQFAYHSSTMKELPSKPGQFDTNARLKGDIGPLIADSAVRNLINGIKLKVSDAYDFVREPKIRTLTDIGVSTGVVGSEWDEISKGYLQVKEEVLLKYLFGLDTDNDLKPESGLGYSLHRYLRAYTRGYGKGILNARISSRKTRIKTINDDIKKTEKKVEEYGKKMKAKFGAMESAIQKQKATSKYLKQKTK